MAEKIRVLFVCLGNIVRSPLGEHMFRHLAGQAGLGDKYEVASAGTASYHVGESPDRRMRQVAAEFGLNYDGAARQFRKSDFENFELIIPMDSDNRSNVLHLASKPEHDQKVYLILMQKITHYSLLWMICKNNFSLLFGSNKIFILDFLKNNI